MRIINKSDDLNRLGKNFHLGSCVFDEDENKIYMKLKNGWEFVEIDPEDKELVKAANGYDPQYCIIPEFTTMKELANKQYGPDGTIYWLEDLETTYVILYGKPDECPDMYDKDMIRFLKILKKMKDKEVK